MLTGEEHDFALKKCKGIFYLQHIENTNKHYLHIHKWYICLKRGYEKEKECNEFCPF